MVNEYFELINYGGSFYYYLFELANFSILALLAMIVYQCGYININSLIVWVGIFLLPIFLNYFLFSPYLFPDQFQYAAEVASQKSRGISIPNIAAQNDNSLEDIGFSFGISAINPVTLTTKILGFAPIPNFMTVTSLAFANKFFLFLTFLWLKKHFENENVLLMYFLIPSLLLYSSLSLRDTLVIILSLLFLIYAFKDRYFISLIILYPLFFLKIQMFAFFSLYYLGRFLFRANKSLASLGIFALSILSLSLFFDDSILGLINGYRYGFAAEDLDLGNGIYGYAAWSIYGQEMMDSLTLNSIPEAILTALVGLPNLLLMPLPWNWNNIFYPVQALESVFLISLYIWIMIKYQLFTNKEFIFLTFILVASLLVYSLLAFNEGTFVRYRFTLFYPFLIGIYFIGTNSKLFKDRE